MNRVVWRPRARIIRPVPSAWDVDLGRREGHQGSQPCTFMLPSSPLSYGVDNRVMSFISSELSIRQSLEQRVVDAGHGGLERSVCFSWGHKMFGGIGTRDRGHGADPGINVLHRPRKKSWVGVCGVFNCHPSSRFRVFSHCSPSLFCAKYQTDLKCVKISP